MESSDPTPRAGPYHGRPGPRIALLPGARDGSRLGRLGDSTDTPGTRPMSDDLLESIVVTAFNRREYYEKAIDSVLPLVQGRSDVEVILLKNFVDEPVDHRLVAAGVQVASYSSPIAEATLRRAIELCRGRYIVFLDDDDLFRPTKLERFERALAQFPELSYYHNGYEMVLEDKAGLGAWERFSLIRSNRERVGSAVRVFTGPA